MELSNSSKVGTCECSTSLWWEYGSLVYSLFRCRVVEAAAHMVE